MTVHTLDAASDARPRLHLHDYEPHVDDFLSAVVSGLSAKDKKLPCKFLYDAKGSLLFDRICSLPEYYPTRTETAIMRTHAAEMADVIGPDSLLVEYGSGSSLKTRLLLDRLARLAGYVPIDISRSHLIRSALALAAAYPRIPVLPVCADYTSEFELPAVRKHKGPVVAYFPGSTIGNFEPQEAVAFLKNVRRMCGHSSGLLIGYDLKKDPSLLHAAYNDAAGVTSSFNLNLLKRINSELNGGFDLTAFGHYAPYNPRLGRVEMHRMQSQVVGIGRQAFSFQHGETVHTESCYKYTHAGFHALAAEAGYRAGKVG